MNIRECPLPGIGVKYQFDTKAATNWLLLNTKMDAANCSLLIQVITKNLH